MLDFLDFGFLDALDILLVAILLYYVYKLVKGTVAINIFLGIAMIFLIWKLTEALKMEMLSEILGKFLGGGVLLLLIVFQQEIRKFLLLLGSTNFASKKGFLKQIPFLKSEVNLETNVDIIVSACKSMSKEKTGALIVIARNNSLEAFKQSGDTMHIEVNVPILKSIFYKNSPLHDGAITIEDNIITATRVILPVANDMNIPTHFGLRHRAAIGVSLQTDALVLVVSEETGKVSYIKNGEFILFDDTDKLVELIKEDLE
ncbi:MAG: diadenylate cyclase [Flavobacteriaceae bacterium]|nr:diadenylate cyclase [Flavobacteriaceae bacterium]